MGINHGDTESTKEKKDIQGILKSTMTEVALVKLDNRIYNLANLVQVDYYTDAPLVREQDGHYRQAYSSDHALIESGAMLDLTFAVMDQGNQVLYASTLFGPRAADLWKHLCQMAVRL